MIDQCVFVLVLHGAGGTGEAMANHTLGAPDNWQIVSPSSPTTTWDLGPGSSDEKWLVSLAKSSNCDTKVVAGFSNGGYMSSALLCRHPQVFDGSFSVNGFTTTPDCKVNKKSHAYVVSSENDPLVNKNGSVHQWAEHIVPGWARVPAKNFVKSMSIASGAHKKVKVTSSKKYKTFSWGNYSWSLEYDATHEWTRNTTRLFINFVKEVEND